MRSSYVLSIAGLASWEPGTCSGPWAPACDAAAVPSLSAQACRLCRGTDGSFPVMVSQPRQLTSPPFVFGRFILKVFYFGSRVFILWVHPPSCSAGDSSFSS